MKRNVRIKGYNQPKEIHSEKTGKDYVMTDVAVEWDEFDAKGQQYTQSMVLTVSSYLNEPVIQSAIDNKVFTEITYYADAEKYNDRWYNRIRGYINKDYLANQKTPLTF